jgi:hypothetical protein
MSAVVTAVAVGCVGGAALGALILWRFPRVHRMIYRWYLRREYRRGYHDHH